MVSLPAHRKCRQSGISLIEVLVSVLLLSVGILGVASLQMYSLKVNTEANLQSQASLQVKDIIEQIRLIPDAPASFAVTSESCQAGSSPSGSGFAHQQLVQWCQSVAATLPGGRGAVTVANGAVTAEVTWLERRERDKAAQAEGEAGEGSVEGEETAVDHTRRISHSLSARVSNE